MAGDFENRLREAIARGQRRGAARHDAARQAELTAAELRVRHNDLRLRLSEQIEEVLRRLADEFPGFQVEILYGDRGWGAAVSRDDRIAPRQSAFSRLEVAVRPLSEVQVVDLAAKGTVRNRELFERQYHEPVASADYDGLARRIESWVLEYAELFAAR